MSKVKGYIPGEKFPAISVTGRKCYLNCPHCQGKYLKHMMDASRGLYNKIKELVEKGIEGVLISGGCSEEGRVPINWEEVKRIKKEFDIKLNVHVGIIRKEEVRKIAEVGVDMVSFDFISQNDVIKRIYGISVENFWTKSILQEFEKEGVKYSPHITIGLDWGRVWWEEEAIRELEERSFKVLVLNVLIPTKGTLMEKVSPPGISEFKRILSLSKEALDVEISLGCMRPRKIEYELAALSLGIDRIAMPSREIIKKLKMKIQNTCCVL